ncbi:hypothetical protein D3C80_1919360 [compost metagenome]
MKLFAGRLGAFYSCNQRFVLKELTVTDRLVNTGQILVYDPACADVKVSYFRVAHLSFRQTYSFAAGGKRSVRILLQVTVIIGFIGLGNRVAFIRIPQSESVHDD